MKLCVISDLNIVHIRRWLNYFILRGHEVHLIGDYPLRCSVPEGLIFHDLTKLNNMRKLRHFIWMPIVRQLVRKIQPDVLHAHWVAGPGWLGAATGFHPFLITAQGSDLLVRAQRSWIQRQLCRWALRQADYVACVSGHLAQKALELGANPDRLEVVYAGIDTGVFYPASNPESARSKLNVGPGPIVLSIRGMRPIYHLLDIAHAIPHVLEQVPSARFIFFVYSCEPEYFARFQATLQELDVKGAVQCVEELADDNAIADFYRIADVAISVPSSDGTPNSVHEAMACGAVPVVSDLPSLHDWVRHEQEGLFVPLGDVAAIGESIVRLLTDSALRQRLRNNGTQLISQRADSKIWMRRSEEIYQHLIESTGGR